MEYNDLFSWNRAVGQSWASASRYTVQNTRDVNKLTTNQLSAILSLGIDIHPGLCIAVVVEVGRRVMGCSGEVINLVKQSTKYPLLAQLGAKLASVEWGNRRLTVSPIFVPDEPARHHAIPSSLIQLGQ